MPSMSQVVPVDPSGGTAKPLPDEQRLRELLVPLARQLALQEGEMEDLVAYLHAVPCRGRARRGEPAAALARLRGGLGAGLALGCWAALCAIEAASAARRHPLAQLEGAAGRWTGTALSLAVLIAASLALAATLAVQRLRPPRIASWRCLLTDLASFAFLLLGGAVWTLWQAAEGQDAQVWTGVIAVYCSASLAVVVAVASLAASATCTVPAAGGATNSAPEASVLVAVSPQGAPAFLAAAKADARTAGGSRGCATCGCPGCGRRVSLSSSHGTNHSGALAGMSSEASIRSISKNSRRKWRPLFKDPTFGGSYTSEFKSSDFQADDVRAFSVGRVAAVDEAVPDTAWPHEDTTPAERSSALAVAAFERRLSMSAERTLVVPVPAACLKADEGSDSGLSADSSNDGAAKPSKPAAGVESSGAEVAAAAPSRSAERSGTEDSGLSDVSADAPIKPKPPDGTPPAESAAPPVSCCAAEALPRLSTTSSGGFTDVSTPDKVDKASAGDEAEPAQVAAAAPPLTAAAVASTASPSRPGIIKKQKSDCSAFSDISKDSGQERGSHIVAFNLVDPLKLKPAQAKPKAEAVGAVSLKLPPPSRREPSKDSGAFSDVSH